MHQDTQQVVCPKAQLLTAQADDAGTAALQHLDRGAAAQSQLFQPLDLLWSAKHLIHTTALAWREQIEWHQVVHGQFTACASQLPNRGRLEGQMLLRLSLS